MEWHLTSTQATTCGFRLSLIKNTLPLRIARLRIGLQTCDGVIPPRDVG